jgi:hypothetical protein
VVTAIPPGSPPLEVTINSFCVHAPDRPVPLANQGSVFRRFRAVYPMMRYRSPSPVGNQDPPSGRVSGVAGNGDASPCYRERDCGKNHKSRMSVGDENNGWEKSFWSTGGCGLGAEPRSLI